MLDTRPKDSFEPRDMVIHREAEERETEKDWDPFGGYSELSQTELTRVIRMLIKPGAGHVTG